MIDPKKLTQKTQSTLQSAAQAAQEAGHAQWTPLHIAAALFEDSQGLAKSITHKAYRKETWEGLCSTIQARLRKLPRMQPPPDEVSPSREAMKLLDAAQKIQKDKGDTFLGIDSLLGAVVASSELTPILTEVGVQKGPLEEALKQVRAASTGSTKPNGGGGGGVDSATADENFESLSKYGQDLTAKAAELDPVIGRDDEIRRGWGHGRG